MTEAEQDSVLPDDVPELATAAVLLLCVGAFQLHAYAVLCRPYSSLPQTVPQPHLPMVPSGTGWGPLPIALVTSDPTGQRRGLTFEQIYVQAIEMGALVTAVGLVLAAMTIARGDASAPPPG